MPLRVYLSGGMEYATDEGKGWREQLDEWFEDEMGYDVFNPNRESERFLQSHYPSIPFREWKHTHPDRFSEIVTRIVDLDCAEIAERSDLVVCYWDEAAARGAGTKGELTMARFFRKPVYLVTQIPFQNIPGWVIGCTTRIFPTFDSLKAFIATSRPPSSDRQ